MDQTGQPVSTTTAPRLNEGTVASGLPPLARLQDVTFGWPGDDPRLIHINDFTIGRGERVFISGPSGSGKSTLLSLLGGVIRPHTGSIDMLCQRLTNMRTAERDKFRADHMGIVFQIFNLVPYLTVLENILLPCLFSETRRQRITLAGTTPEKQARFLLDRLELDHHRLGRRPVVSLSIGQQQRVAVARALIGSPELIIADEPTSALDEGTSQHFVELLLNESREHGTGVVFVSHDIRLAAQFDRHVYFEAMNQRVTVAHSAQSRAGS